MKLQKNVKGFTLIEILVVIGIIAALATIVIVAVNPDRQFKQAQNTERSSHVNTLLNAVGQRIADKKGVFAEGNCAAIPGTATEISSGGYNIYPCLFPDYLSKFPFEPIGGQFTSETSYNLGYTIMQDSNGRVTVAAPKAQLSQKIEVTR